jgi:aminoglycoside 6'-N-acetyltransferase I
MKSEAFIIRQMIETDKALWQAMRCALWPEEGNEDHATMMQQILLAEDAWAFIAQTSDGRHAGFAELAIRKYANGCVSAPVPFLEGIWVEPHFRRKGVAVQLVRYVETFVKARGFREIGSDALLDNKVSYAAHEAWGFIETERVVYFRKSI